MPLHPRAGLIPLAIALAFGIAIPASAAGDEPAMSPGVERVPHDPKVFKADPVYATQSYDPARQIEIYGGKRDVPEPRPLLEVGRPLYREGPLPPSYHFLGAKNPVSPSLILYGDWRTAIASNDNGRGKSTSQVATRLNLEADFAITSTERIHALFRPFDKGGRFTRHEFAGENGRSEFILDGNVDALFFEGDLGNIAAGLFGTYGSLDVPVAAGLMPLVFQNGVWMDDAITGFAVGHAGRNSRSLGISNMDVSVFAGFNKVSSPALRNAAGEPADRDARVIGAALFLDANEGHWEFGLGHVEGKNALTDQGYSSAAISFTRRYGGWLSNSIRIVGAFGQDRERNRQQSADGFVVLLENSLITSKPLTLVPYFNAFAGFDRPQSLARDSGAGGILKNIGILFETDGLTNFPKLDDTAHNTYGGSLGLQYLFNLDQQIVVEVAGLNVHGGTLEAGRSARGAQFGAGIRYQLPLTKSLIFRADAIAAHRENDENIYGVRSELRLKF
jgi:hypothetical protein